MLVYSVPHPTPWHIPYTQLCIRRWLYLYYPRNDIHTYILHTSRVNAQNTYTINTISRKRLYRVEVIVTSNTQLPHSSSIVARLFSSLLQMGKLGSSPLAGLAALGLGGLAAPANTGGLNPAGNFPIADKSAQWQFPPAAEWEAREIADIIVCGNIRGGKLQFYFNAMFFFYWGFGHGLFK